MHYINIHQPESIVFVMDTTKKMRGRPRHFDPDEAIVTAQKLFHAHGYDAVSVADVTQAIGINPPSFYAAFGSKAGLYARVLEHYNATGAILFANILSADRPVAEALTSLLEEAARHYSADQMAAGCMVIEGARCHDADARNAARVFQKAAETMIHDYIAERHPDKARSVTDFICTTIAGLSAEARNSYDLERLLEVSRVASLSLSAALVD